MNDVKIDDKNSILNFKTDNFDVDYEELEKIHTTCQNISLIENINENNKIIKDLEKSFKEKDKYLKKSYWSYKEMQETSEEIRLRIKKIFYIFDINLNKLGFKLLLKESIYGIYFLIEAFDEKIYLRLREKSKMIDNPKEDKYERKIPVPNGQLEIAEMEEEWKALKWNSVLAVDTKTKKIESKIGNLLEQILLLAIEQKDRKINKEKNRIRELKEREIISEKIQIQKNEQNKFNKLKNDAQDFATAQNIREYIKAYKNKPNLSENDKEYIKWAIKKADWLDPLTDEKDEILDEKINTFFY